MFRLIRTLLVAAAASLSIGVPVKAQDVPLTVFAAASLKDVLESAGKAYEAGGGKPVRFSFAASSALAKQIEAGAPADLFASADSQWMDYLASKNLILASSRIDLLGNDLVLVAPASSPLTGLDLTPAAFDKALGDGRLAVGEMKSVPAGRYAKEALERLGLLATLEPRLAQAENVRAALVLVARGEAPLGIVYATDARAEKNVKVLATFPAASHAPIIYPFAVTTTARGGQAEAFLAFLRGPAARPIFEAAGFPVLAAPATN